MSSESSGRGIGYQVVDKVATVIRWAGLIVAIILIARVVLTIGDANPDNGIASAVFAWSDPLAWGFKNLFTPSPEKLRVLVNYGIAALFWLIISAIVAKIVRRLGGA